MVRDKDFRVVYDETEFSAALARSFGGLTIFKIHGSAESMPSIRTTLQDVASKKLADGRREALDYLFQTGLHNRVLVMGYSCSDVFDIVPAVEAITNCDKEVILVDHRQGCDSFSSVELGESNTAFRDYQGCLVQCDTDILVRDIWQSNQPAIGPYQKAITSTDTWQASIRAWAQDLGGEQNGLQRSFVMSVLMYEACEYARSIAHTEECVRLAQGTNKQTMLPMLYNNLAMSYGQLGNSVEYERFSGLATTAAAELGDLRREAESSIGMAPLLIMRGDYDKALELHHRALDIAQQLRADDLLALSHCGMANIHNLRQDYAASEASAHKALEISSSLPMNSDAMRIQSRSHCYLAITYSALGREREAQEHGDTALRIGESLGNDGDLVAAYATLSENAYSAGNRSLAIQLRCKAAEMADRLDNKLFAFPLHMIAGMWMTEEVKGSRGQRAQLFTEAELHFGRAVVLARDMQNPELEGDTHCAWGDICEETGDYERALEHYSAGEELLRSLDNAPNLGYARAGRERARRMARLV